MTNLAIIGGTGLSRMTGLVVTRREMVKTPYGAPSCPLLFGELHGVPIVFLSRHGSKQTIPAHAVNYRANIWALHSVGVERVIAVGVVGGIDDACKVGSIVIPDQIIDYSHDRKSSFQEELTSGVHQIDFSYPYNSALRQALISGSAAAAVPLVDHGTYGASVGPRLETVAEIVRMERDGCSIVGMSGMPEAVLARELAIDYALCALVVNPAAGKGDGEIKMGDWGSAVEAGMENVHAVMQHTLPALS